MLALSRPPPVVSLAVVQQLKLYSAEDFLAPTAQAPGLVLLDPAVS